MPPSRGERSGRRSRSDRRGRPSSLSPLRPRRDPDKASAHSPGGHRHAGHRRQESVGAGRDDIGRDDSKRQRSGTAGEHGTRPGDTSRRRSGAGERDEDVHLHAEAQRERKRGADHASHHARHASRRDREEHHGKQPRRSGQDEKDDLGPRTRSLPDQPPDSRTNQRRDAGDRREGRRHEASSSARGGKTVEDRRNGSQESHSYSDGDEQDRPSDTVAEASRSSRRVELSGVPSPAPKEESMGIAEFMRNAITSDIIDRDKSRDKSRDRSLDPTRGARSRHDREDGAGRRREDSRRKSGDGVGASEDSQLQQRLKNLQSSPAAQAGRGEDGHSKSGSRNEERDSKAAPWHSDRQGQPQRERGEQTSERRRDSQRNRGQDRNEFRRSEGGDQRGNHWSHDGPGNRSTTRSQEDHRHRPWQGNESPQDFQDQREEEVFPLPHHFRTQLQKERKTWLEELKQKHSVRISIEPGADYAKVSIKGEKDAIEAASKEIFEELQPSDDNLEMRIEQSLVEDFLGKDEKEMKAINSRTEATVTIDQSTKDKGYSTVHISGTIENVDAAYFQVEKQIRLIAEARKAAVMDVAKPAAITDAPPMDSAGSPPAIEDGVATKSSSRDVRREPSRSRSRDAYEEKKKSQADAIFSKDDMEPPPGNFTLAKTTTARESKVSNVRDSRSGHARDSQSQYSYTNYSDDDLTDLEEDQEEQAPERPPPSASPPDEEDKVRPSPSPPRDLVPLESLKRRAAEQGIETERQKESAASNIPTPPPPPPRAIAVPEVAKDSASPPSTVANEPALDSSAIKEKTSNVVVPRPPSEPPAAHLLEHRQETAISATRCGEKDIASFKAKLAEVKRVQEAKESVAATNSQPVQRSSVVVEEAVSIGKVFVPTPPATPPPRPEVPKAVLPKEQTLVVASPMESPAKPPQPPMPPPLPPPPPVMTIVPPPQTQPPANTTVTMTTTPPQTQPAAVKAPQLVLPPAKTVPPPEKGPLPKPPFVLEPSATEVATPKISPANSLAAGAQTPKGPPPKTVSPPEKKLSPTVAKAGATVGNSPVATHQNEKGKGKDEFKGYGKGGKDGKGKDKNTWKGKCGKGCKGGRDWHESEGVGNKGEWGGKGYKSGKHEGYGSEDASDGKGGKGWKGSQAVDADGQDNSSSLLRRVCQAKKPGDAFRVHEAESNPPALMPTAKTMPGRSAHWPDDGGGTVESSSEGSKPDPALSKSGAKAAAVGAVNKAASAALSMTKAKPQERPPESHTISPSVIQSVQENYSQSEGGWGDSSWSDSGWADSAWTDNDWSVGQSTWEGAWDDTWGNSAGDYSAMEIAPLPGDIVQLANRPEVDSWD